MKKMKRNLFKKTIIFVLVLAGTVFAGIYILSPALFFKNSGSRWGGISAAENITPERVNILLLGFDRSAERDKTFSSFRPDTIMIASLNFKSKQVSLASIPRDSYVKIAGKEIYDKINHSYMYGHDLPGVKDAHQNGIDTTIRTIEDFLGGIPIHYYVTVDMDGVREIVDQVGGVYFDVKHPVKSDCGYIMLEQGYQLLDGNKFLTFVRDRSVGSDFGRAARQQEIMIEAFKQIKSQGKLADIPAYYSTVQNNVETNLSMAQIAQLGLFGLRVKADTITTHVFSGSNQFAPRNGLDISYVVIDEQARVKLIKEVFGADVLVRPQIVLPGPAYRPVQQQPLTEQAGPETPLKPDPDPEAGAEAAPEQDPPAPTGEEPDDSEDGDEQPGGTDQPGGESEMPPDEQN